MSAIKFIAVSVQEWDNSKLLIEMKDDKLTFLYDGLIPILKIVGTEEEPFLLSCPDGLKQNMKFNSTTRKFTKDWAGDWSLSFKLTSNLSTIRPPDEGVDDKRTGADKLRWKLIDILEFMKGMLAEATDQRTLDTVSYKKTFVTNKMGKQVPNGIDLNSYAYVTGKVNYVADEGCETMRDRDRDVPVFSARQPKTKMYDLSRAEGEELLQDPATEGAVPMMTNPSITFFINNSAQGWNVQRYVSSVYFRPDKSLKISSDGGISDMRRMIYNQKQLLDEIPE